MPSRAVLVANGPIRWTPELAAVAASGQPLLAADGGADALARLGLRPAAVIGDLDSIGASTRAWLGERCLVARADQDRTDLDKALRYALDELGLERLDVLGALGGRADHAAANLGLLARRGRGESLRLLEPGLVVLAVSGAARLAAVPGEVWSFMTFDPAVRTRLDGLRWPVAGAALDLAGAPSVSNRAAAETVVVRTEGGAVVVMRHLLTESF